MNNILSSRTGKSEEQAAVNGQPGSAAVSLINLNEVVHNNLVSRRDKIDSIQAIIRYDLLPHIAVGDRAGFLQLFNLILASILDSPPSGSKLFIYIRCEIEASEIMDLSLAEGFHRFCISVFTNISTDAGWQALQQQHIAAMQAYMQSIDAGFTCHNIYNTGCLYSLVLPGKLI